MKIKNYNIEDVTKIVIYGHGEKLYEIDSNSFKPCKIIASSKGEDKIEEFSYWYKISDIKLNGEIVNARKENLNRSDNYFLSYKREYWQNKGIALYIHESEISVKSLGNILAMETEEEKNYLAAFELTFNIPVVISEYMIEKIICDNFTLPENGKWSNCYGTKEKPCFDTFDYTNSLFAIKRGEAEKGVIKRWMEEKTIENLTMLVTQRYYTKTEYSEDRIRKDKLAQALNDSKLFHNEHFSHYDIDKFEKVFGKLSLVNQ